MTFCPNRLWAALKQVWPQATLPEALPELGDAPQLVTDSRDVKTGDVFVAVPGSQRDGRDFIDQALAQGASLVMAHAKQGGMLLEDRILYLPYLGMRLGELGHVLFDVPDNLSIIAVTGTNGKSSVTHYIAALSELLGTPAGVIGTLGVGRPGNLTDTGLTTPGTLMMQHTLGELGAQGVRRVAIEASSHALDQRRLDAVEVSAAVFTNISRDHLDYHGSMAAYAASKAKLFRRNELALAVVNGDDPLARLMLAGIDSKLRVLATGVDESVTLRVLDWHPHDSGQQVLIATPEGEKALELGLMGRFNLDNVLLAVATLYGMGESLDALLKAASQLSPVPGRMALYRVPGAPSVVVDYAHTPAALDNALSALRAHLGDAGKLWCVFGCGGDRDAGKREAMAEVAERHADHVVVTDDNPRFESAEQIRKQIAAGFQTPAAHLDIAPRSKAIDHAITQAAEGDVVMVAGKGHEPYQDIEGVKHPYHDDDEVASALAKRSVAR